MPKNTVAPKSKIRTKSTRKPLRDVSNARIAVKATDNLKQTAPEDSQRAGGGSLDRLLLVHSDISSLLHQIDELVVKALQQTGNEGREEIKEFADVLSDMQTSLKPWIPRLQKVLSLGLDENKLEQLEDQSVIRVPKESTDAIMDSPKGAKWESIVSPSPLVSWRAECNTKCGRQLFLLTPLPQTKSFSSIHRASSIPALEMTFEETAHPVSLHDSMQSVDSNQPEVVSTKPPIGKVSDSGNLETICGSPPPHSKKDCCMFVMTPCLKMSPPKSCILLEPMSGFSKKRNPVAIHKSTPFPTIVHNSDSEDSESSSNQSSDDLKVKYPELFGINLNNLGNRKVAEESPNWIVSPPKTCVIMEPSDENPSKNLPGNCLPSRTTPFHIQKDKSGFQDIRVVALDLTERTPMIKEPISTLRMGKRPGENTLKKELWTKFEAASSHGNFCFDPSILDDTSQKGFLDLLEEAFEP